MTNSTTFVIGVTYIMGWIGDSELKTEYKVISRTAKFVTVQNRGEVIRCKIEVYSDSEQCSPTGKYSMSPVLRAEKIK